MSPQVYSGAGSDAQPEGRRDGQREATRREAQPEARLKSQRDARPQAQSDSQPDARPESHPDAARADAQPDSPNQPPGETAPQAGWLRKATGWGLLLAGIAGCLLPVLPGFPLVIAGLLILARDYQWARRALFRAKRWAVQLRRKAGARRGAEPSVAEGGDGRRKGSGESKVREES